MTSAVSSRLRSALFHVLRAAFRALPISESTQDRLRQQFLDRFPTIRPRKPRGVPATGLPRRPYVHSGGRALGYVEHRVEPLPDPLPATLVAFYLPQFHTIPENDEWWGKGFTEWRNVARALPQFEGHAQPRLPGDLGFYDLRNPQVMRDQAKLAREYGISAFCFYFYWFGGKTLLEEPLQQWLNDPSIDLSFCLCWANENWSRRWDGRTEDLLIAQANGPGDDLAFICYVAPYLRDPRYLRVDGKPLLLVYRPGSLKDPAVSAQLWRAWCRENGIGEIHLAYVQSFERPDPNDIGFDAGVEFPPNLSSSIDITAKCTLINPEYTGEILDWRELARDYMTRSQATYRLYPGVNCGWDNEPRRAGRGRTFVHASPRRYRDWLMEAIRRQQPVHFSERVVFINAWNEWAEGAVLEPDKHLGHAWLNATRSALKALSSPPPQSGHHARPCVVIHAWYADIFASLLDSLIASEMDFRLVVTTGATQAASIRDVLSTLPLRAELEIHENRGRDILPFLRVANRLLDEGESLVLKLHTKRSPHISDGQRWREELIGGLLHRAGKVIGMFQEDATLGMAAPSSHLLSVNDFLGGNTRLLHDVLVRTGMEKHVAEQSEFPAGSMFWARLEALRPILDAHFAEWEFEAEGSQVDGTLAHTIERVFGASVVSTGYRIFPMPEAKSMSGSKYPFANPD